MQRYCPGTAFLVEAVVYPCAVMLLCYRKFLYDQWDRLSGSHYPAMTIGYLSALGLPEIKIEIEIWAAKV